MFLQLFIINRSGGLIYNKNLSSFAPNLSTNDCLRLGKYDRGTSIIIFIIRGTDKLVDYAVLYNRQHFPWLTRHHTSDSTNPFLWDRATGNRLLRSAELTDFDRSEVRHHSKAWHCGTAGTASEYVRDIRRFRIEGIVRLLNAALSFVDEIIISMLSP
jgi:hypothetical protein